MDIIIYNGHIRTMDSLNPLVSALAIKDGQIEALGADGDVLALKTGQTRLIDAAGRCIIPGLNDSHMHLLGYAAGKSGVDLSKARSAREITALIRNHIDEKKLPEGALVTGRGFNDNMFTEKGFPTRLDLDAASTKHPVYIARACHHIAVANSLLINRSGIGRDTAVEGGEVLHFDDGEPNGILTENAMGLVKIDREPMTTAQIRELIALAAPELAALGITSVQTDDFSGLFPRKAVLEAYSSMALEGKLNFRVTEKRRGPTPEDCREVLSLKVPDGIERFFRLGPVKLFADGSLGGHTAYMQEDYKDKPGYRGVPIYERESFAALVDLVHKSGGDVAVHAIGDGAIAMTLDAIEASQKANPRPEARHGIVHAQITTPLLLERFKSLNVFAYIQPIFLHADALITDARVGTEKAATSYAFKTLMDSGVPVPMGTDCPVEPLDPFDNIYCAVTRKGLTGLPAGGFYPAQALSAEEAVRAYTLDSAYASREEHIKGMLAPGYAADLAMLSRNIFTEPTEAIPGTVSVLTIVDGRVVYEMRSGN